METYEKLARFIELNYDGLQTCLNTTFTQDCKKKNAVEALTWKLDGASEYLIFFICTPLNKLSN